MLVARHVRVTGRVQGVLFRGWTAEKAQSLGVSGWVRNDSDGSVEVHLEGERWDVQQLIELLQRGPPSAEVTRVDVKDVDFQRIGRFDVRP